MKFTQLFTKTLKDAPADETAVNAQLLIRGGFVFKNSAGVYSYLPLGWRVMNKIMTIIREEMDAIGGQELFMPALVEKKYMEPTGRWDLDVGFFAKSKNDDEASFTLGWTHEEVLTSIAAKYVSSYKDLPFSSYQIQTKFRHEARAKSGLLRGREFMMKDLYSFHATEADLDAYYEKVRAAYVRVFERCGVAAIYTLAAGGVFTKSFTHEFQVQAAVGEDTIYVDRAKGMAVNKEVLTDDVLRDLGMNRDNLEEVSAIEVGNIFKQGTKYSEDLGLFFTDADGTRKPVVMGSYGIGVSRLMATLVELDHDDKGIRWPAAVAPFSAHIVSIGQNGRADKIYQMLKDEGVDVLYDDRQERTPGEKFADADLIGCPVRLTIGGKTPETQVEWRDRANGDTKLVAESELVSLLR